MKANFTCWVNPILNDDTRNLLEENYGENASFFIHVLKNSPARGEIAVVSALLAYLNTIKRR